MEADEPWAVFEGLAERPVFAVRGTKIAMLVSRLDRVKLDDPRHVVRHGQVIHHVFEKRTVLPFRYGTTFTSEDEIRALLHQNREQFTESLRVLRGKAEVHLKISFRVRHSAPLRVMAVAAGAGRAASRVVIPSPKLTVSSQGYAIAPNEPLEARAKRQSDHLIESLRTALQPEQDLVSVRHGDRGEVTLDFRCLVSDEQVDSCKKFAVSGVSDLEESQVLVTGPWPPCHFLPVAAKLPARAERLVALPGRLPLRNRMVRV